MASYVRTTTIDSGPTGDSVKQAVLDLDADLTGIVAAYNVHDPLTTNVHGFTGTKTGSGAMVGDNTPTLITPVLGVATATSINKVTLTQPATGSTLTVADGKTLTASATMTLTGTDSTQLSLAGNLTTSGAFATTLTTTAGTSVTLPTSGTLVSSVTTGNGVSATNTAGALAFALGEITPTKVNGITLASGTNTFSHTVGSASIDVAAGCTVNVDKSLTVQGTYGTVLSSAGQDNTITLNESLTIGDGNSGTITFTGASKTLSVEGTSVVNQDLTTDASPQFAAIKLTSGAALGDVLTAAADGTASWALPSSGSVIGSVTLFASQTVPAGYLECNGASLARVGTYANLYDAIGTLWGAADGNHFNIPDLRGTFVRGWDHGRGADPDTGTRSGGDTVASTQGSTFTSHAHSYTYPATIPDINNSSGGTAFAYVGGSTTSGATGGNETRPINTNLMYIIKY